MDQDWNYFSNLFNSLDLVTLRCLGLTEEVVVVSVLHEASVLLINSRLLGVGDSEVLVLAHHPVSKTRVLHCLVLRVLHALALLERHVELLVGDEELGADVLTGVNNLFWMRTYTRGGVSVLVGELKHSLDGRPSNTQYCENVKKIFEDVKPFLRI